VTPERALAAAETGTRAIRLRTLDDARALEPIPIDQRVADTWAELRIALRDAGRRMPVNDSWVAATAIAHSFPLATRDDDDDSVPGLRVVRV
jgi:predicted nucleic acid-binding protein